MRLNCAGKFLELSSPQIMGVLNITPNSFSSVGRFLSLEEALRHARQMVEDGATIIDVGGEPTNPGVHPVVSLQEELDRVVPVVAALASELSVPISVDTSKPEVMRAAIASGAGFINDVRGFCDPAALAVVAETGVAICIMHMSHPFGNTSGLPDESLAGDPVLAIKDFLQSRVDACLAAGVMREKITVDPGVGHGNFGKNLLQNLQIVARLSELNSLNLPILIGLSRKTFIGEILNLPSEERLYGSLGAAVLAALNGAKIIRVHDVRATVEALKVAMAISHIMP